MTTTTEKQATGFEMSYKGCLDDDSWVAKVWQDRRLVFAAYGCSSKQHAEQIARDIMVRYALTERPTI